MNEFKQRWDLNCYQYNEDSLNAKGVYGFLPIALPEPKFLELKENNIVYFHKDGKRTKGKILNIIIQYNYDESEKGWNYYYDVKSEATHHNRKYCQLNELEFE